MKILKWLLFPLGLIFGLIAEIRRWLYQNNLFSRTKPKIPSIGIGNLSVGGTGKTPISLYLIRLFEKKYSIGFISRGYKRRTKGMVEAQSNLLWQDLGDEPFLVKKTYPNTVVMVDANRKRALQYLEKKEPKVDLLIFDDVLQHLKVKTGFKILLTEYSNPFYVDLILPTGRLREFRKNAKFCDAIIMTKCPSILSPIERRHLEQKILKYTRAKIFFSNLIFSPLIPLNSYLSEKDFHNEGTNIKLCNEFTTLGVCGIANPFSFEDYLRRNSNFSGLMEFPDHHKFQKTDINKIKEKFQSIREQKKIIVITEKDAVKLGEPEIIDEVENLPMFVLPIEVKFDGNDQFNFENTIKNYVEQN